MDELALSAKDQINKHMDNNPEPKLDEPLAKKVKHTAMQCKTLNNLNCYGMDIAPRNTFENQVIP